MKQVFQLLTRFALLWISCGLRCVIIGCDEEFGFIDTGGTFLTSVTRS